MKPAELNLSDILGDAAVKVTFTNGKSCVVKDVPMEVYLKLLDDAKEQTNLHVIVDFLAAISGMTKGEVAKLGVKECQKAFIKIQEYLLGAPDETPPEDVKPTVPLK